MVVVGMHSCRYLSNPRNNEQCTWGGRTLVYVRRYLYYVRTWVPDTHKILVALVGHAIVNQHFKAHGCCLMALAFSPRPTSPSLVTQPWNQTCESCFAKSCPEPQETTRDARVPGANRSRQDATRDDCLAESLTVVKTTAATVLFPRAAKDSRDPTRDSLFVRSRQERFGMSRQEFSTRPEPVVWPGWILGTRNKIFPRTGVRA